MLEFFRERRDALLGRRLHPELTLDVEVRLYGNFILQLESEMATSEEKERIFSEKWHLSTQNALDRLRKVKDLKSSLQEMTSELDAARGEIHQLRQTIESENAVDFLRSCLEEVQRENVTLRKRVNRCKQEWDRRARGQKQLL